jgi:PAS domain S-box-containing protein
MVKRSNSKMPSSQEIAEMRRRLDELEQTLSAIQNGEVDALLVSGDAGEQVYTLKSSEHPYRVMIEQMSEGALTLSAEGIILYCNESFARMVKYPLEEILATPMAQYIGPASRNQFQRLLRQNGRGEINLLTRNLDSVPAYAAVNTVPEGDVINYSVVITDLTEHLHTEQIIASERFARTMMEQAADILVVCKNDGTIIRASEKALNLIGADPEGSKFDEVFNLLYPVTSTARPLSPDITAKPLNLSAVCRGDIPAGCEIALYADGQAKQSYLLNFSPLVGEGELLGYSIALTDITERKRIEEALKASEQRWATTLSSIGDAVIATDTAGRVTFMNTVAESLTGWRLQESESRPVTEVFNIINELTRQKVDNPVSKVLQQGMIVGLANHTLLVRKDGSEVPVDDSGAPIQGPDGKVIGTVLIFRDITERKRTEEALQKYTRELENANKELESFSYSVSHDLRAPLRALDGFSRAVVEEYGDKLDEQGKDYLNRVRKASQHMSDLINDLLKLSRLSRAEMNIQKVNLSEIAQSILEELRSSQPDRKVEWVISPEVIVRGDNALLTIALQNLLDNSWKFSNKCPQARIEFGITEQNREKIYFVKDNGAGFNMQYSDKLFQPFQRLHSAKDFEGTGIGLATVQRVIRRHGGRIWADSEKGKGATFYFTLGE